MLATGHKNHKSASNWGLFVLISLLCQPCSASAAIETNIFSGAKISHIQREIQNALDDVKLIRDLVQGFVSRTPTGDSARTIYSMLSDISSGTGIGQYADQQPDRPIERYVSLGGNQSQEQAVLVWMEPSATILPVIAERRDSLSAAWISTSSADDSAGRGAWAHYPTLYPSNLGSFISGGGDYKAHLREQSTDDDGSIYLTNPYEDALVSANGGNDTHILSAHTLLQYNIENNGDLQISTATIGVDVSLNALAEMLEQGLPRGTKSFAMVVRRRSHGGFQTVLSTDQNHTLTDDEWEILTTKIMALSPGEESSQHINGAHAEMEVQVHRWLPFEETISGGIDDVWSTIIFSPRRDQLLHVEVSVYEGFPQTQNDTTSNVIQHNNQSQGEAREAEYDLELLIPQPSAGEPVGTHFVFENTGAVDATITVVEMPSWLSPVNSTQQQLIQGNISNETFFLPLEWPTKRKLMAGESWKLAVVVSDLNMTDTTEFGVATFLVEGPVDGSSDSPLEVMTVTIVATGSWEVQHIYLSFNKCFGMFLAGTVFLASVAWSIWIMRNSSHRVVRASQPIFLHLMLFGLVVLGMCLVSMSIDDEVYGQQGAEIACNCNLWFIVMGFNFTFAALYSKVSRLNQMIAASKRYRSVRVSLRHVLVPFLFLTGVNVPLLSIYTALFPMKWLRRPKSANPHLTWGTCERDYNNIWETVVMVALLLVMATGMTLAIVNLYRARGLSTEYNEGKWIGAALGTMTLMGCVSAPVMFVNAEDTYTNYYSRTIIIWVAIVSLMTLTFLPKFFMAGMEDQPSTHPGSTGHSSDHISKNKVEGLEDRSAVDILDVDMQKHRVPVSLLASMVMEEEEGGVGMPELPQRRHLISSGRDIEPLHNLPRRLPPGVSEGNPRNTISTLTVSVTDSEAEFWNNVHTAYAGNDSRSLVSTGASLDPPAPPRTSFQQPAPSGRLSACVELPSSQTVPPGDDPGPVPQPSGDDKLGAAPDYPVDLEDPKS